MTPAFPGLQPVVENEKAAASGPVFFTKDVVGEYTLEFRGSDSISAYDVALYSNRTWETTSPMARVRAVIGSGRPRISTGCSGTRPLQGRGDAAGRRVDRPRAGRGDAAGGSIAARDGPAAEGPPPTASRRLRDARSPRAQAGGARLAGTWNVFDDSVDHPSGIDVRRSRLL